MDRPLVIGVMGGGNVDPATMENAYELGRLVAGQDWCLLNGGRDSGVMEASAKGACENGGMTIGILPDDTSQAASPYIRIPICTGMGMARYCINVLSSDVVVACPGGAGTLSEIALALKAGKPVITMGFQLNELPGIRSGTSEIFYAGTPQEVIKIIKKIVQKGNK